MAAEKGFEPLRTDPESVVLPLHHSAAIPSGCSPMTLLIIAPPHGFVKVFFDFFAVLRFSGRSEQKSSARPRRRHAHFSLFDRAGQANQ